MPAYTPQVDVSNLLNATSELIPPFLLDKPSRFSLDLAGVAGLMGGDDAVSAMATVHVYGNRRWLGWYNTPGAFQIAKRLRSFANSASLPSVFGANQSPKTRSQSVHTDPTTLFELDICKGPKYRAAHSGTVIQETGYLAALFMKECAAWNGEGKIVLGRRSQPIGVTIADLAQAPAPETHPAYSRLSTLCFASIPIATSIGACVVCAVYNDLYASFLILVGIVASGISCLVLGSADFVFAHPEPAKSSPAGDGILISDRDFVILRGTEDAVNSVTRGRFTLRFANATHISLIRWCSLLFFAQCGIQLLFIPRASLFGQVMFLASLGVSTLYNGWLSSLDKEKIHQKLLCERVFECPPLTKYTLGTRTTAVVFALLVLQLHDPTGLLDELLPNDTKVWKEWKATIKERLRHPDEQFFIPNDRGRELTMEGFTQKEVDLLELLFEDARTAYRGYKDYLGVDAL